LQELLAIRFLKNPAVQNGDDALVGFAPNQPAEPLFEFQNCHRHLIFIEGIDSLRPQPFDSPLNEGMAGNGKRQPHNNHIGQFVPRNIHPLPEAVRAEEHAAGKGLELSQQRCPVQSFPLNKGGHLLFGQPRRQAGRHLFEHSMAGKEHEGTAFGFEEIFLDGFDRLFAERLAVRVGHVGFQIEPYLPAVVKRRAQLERLKIVQSDSSGKKGKTIFDVCTAFIAFTAFRVLAAAAEGGTGEHHRIVRLQKAGPHIRSHIQRSTMQRNIFPQSRFRLDPIDKSFLRLLKKQFQILFYFLTAIDEPLIFHLLVFVFGLFRQAAEFQAELTERLAEVIAYKIR